MADGEATPENDGGLAARVPVVTTLLALAGIRVGENVLDAGCGTGLLTHAAAAAVGPGGHVVGFDSDATALVVARARPQAGVTWVRGDLRVLPFRDGAFDKVLTATTPVAECARVLKRGGRLALAVRGGDAVAGLTKAGLSMLHESTGTLPNGDVIRYVSAVRT